MNVGQLLQVRECGPAAAGSWMWASCCRCMYVGQLLQVHGCGPAAAGA